MEPKPPNPEVKGLNSISNGIRILFLELTVNSNSNKRQFMDHVKPETWVGDKQP